MLTTFLSVWCQDFCALLFTLVTGVLQKKKLAPSHWAGKLSPTKPNQVDFLSAELIRAFDMLIHMTK